MNLCLLANQKLGRTFRVRPLFLFLLKSVFFFGYVPTASMEPAIREGSFMFGTRVSGGLQCGDIAVFKHENHLIVKRVAGIGGDVVYAASGGALTIPDGCYFMLGDNEAVSNDSQFWEKPFVSSGEIIAKVWAA